MLLLLALALVLSSPHHVLADLPVHCIMSQVLGTWDYLASSSLQDSSSSSSFPAACSHDQPDNLQTTLQLNRSFDNPGFASLDSGHFTLHNYTSAELCSSASSSCEPAEWSMVYDEYVFVRGLVSGRELLLGFRFLRATTQGDSDTPDDLDDDDAVEYVSLCDETQVGWISDSVRDRHACAVARNRVRSPPQPPTRIAPAIKATSSIKQAVLERLASAAQASALERLAHEINSAEHAFSWRASTSGVPQYTGFSDSSPATNTNATSSSSGFKPNTYALHRIASKPLRQQERHRRQCMRRVLPAQVDWSSEGQVTRTPVQRQGECGSCYAVASLDAFISRIQLALNNNTTLRFAPVDTIVQCSVENQGCHGGFPWLVGRFAKYRGVSLADCNGGGGDTCSKTCTRIKALKWGYVGGRYGRGTEEDMMWSLFRDGPLVVGINASPALSLYSSGVFQDPEATRQSLRALHESQALWEPSTHAVTLVGYSGREWKLKNSWGEVWGEQGYFRLAKGRDAIAVESMAVHALFAHQPGNKEFESVVRSNLARFPECEDAIEAMLKKDLV